MQTRVVGLALCVAITFGFSASADSRVGRQKLDWATSASGSDPAGVAGFGIATDRRGNSYVTGYFEGTVTFGAGELKETVLTSTSPEIHATDMVLAKYAPDGTLLWVTSAGGVASDTGHEVATDRHGNSYVTGKFDGMATFGAGEANETVLTGADTGDVFVAKYAPNGILLWATNSVGADDAVSANEGMGIATDPRGNSYLTGTLRGIATFGAGEANETVLNSAGGLAVFVAKYAPGGTLLWAASPGPAVGSEIATDRRGNAYVTGQFFGTVTFGAGETNETLLSGDPDGEIFIAKYASDGALLWAASAGGAGRDLGYGIATDRHGNSYVTGEFFRTATFGAGETNETLLSGDPDAGVFVAKYASDGTLLWAKSAIGASDDAGLSIATDRHGNGHVAGQFFGTVTFGAGEANETTLNSAGNRDVFVAKYTPDGTFLWATRAGGPELADGDAGFAIETDQHGDSYITGVFEDTATFGAGEANETVLSGAAFSLFVAKYGPSPVKRKHPKKLHFRGGPCCSSGLPAVFP
jgi:hypothetical protein